MERIFPTTDEIIDYFQKRHGFISVIDIVNALVVPHVNRSTTMDEEWQHVRKELHKLRSEGYLLIQNEGADIYNEKFSSTPDRLEKFYEESTKAKNFYNNRNQNKIGKVTFDYSNNNGLYFIGDYDYSFGIKFSGASQQSIYVYKDHETIECLALIKEVTDFDQVNFSRKYDGTSRTRCPEIGQIVLLKNKNDRYALIKIESIKMESRGDKNDEVSFSFKILDDKYQDLIAGEEKTELKQKSNAVVGSHPGVFIAARKIENDGHISGPRVDVITEHYSGKGSVSADQPHKQPDAKSPLLERLTNNQTFAIVVGGLILAFIFYLIYSHSGINLSQY